MGGLLVMLILTMIIGADRIPFRTVLDAFLRFDQEVFAQVTVRDIRLPRFLADIMQEGLKPMSRQYVHLSPDAETAYRVGIRHGKPVILQVDALRMVQDGMKIYRAENGVWLTDAVPPQYLQITGTAQPETE